MNSKPVFRRKSEKPKNFTKFFEFRFHVPTKAKPKKLYLGSLILEKFLAKPLDKIKKRATLSKKNTIKIIVLIYNSALQRLLIEEYPNLVDVVYDEFFSRYGLKSVAHKRFLEFIASVINHSDNKRCAMLIKFLGYGEILFLTSYSKFSLKIYLSCLEFIHTSNLGIFICDDDNKVMIPTLRIVECIRETLDFLAEKSVLACIHSKIEQIVVPDPKKINPGGVVELENCLEIIVEDYDKYIKSIWKGLNRCLKALGLHNKHTIFSADFSSICRALGKTFKETGKHSVVEEIYFYCIKNNIASEEEILKFTPSISKEDLFSQVSAQRKNIVNIIENLQAKDSGCDPIV